MSYNRQPLKMNIDDVEDDKNLKTAEKIRNIKRKYTRRYKLSQRKK